jgi:D-glycero-D-manno-heptose 1,7-bisphosphate phosphatase
MAASGTRSPAIFLDRDGVIIHNRVNYVRSWQDVRLYAHAVPALVSLRHSPYKLVIVTNQAGVGKQLFSLDTVKAINDGIVACIQAAGGKIDGVFVCPHRSDEQCNCRKPKPGLLLQAAQALSIDLSRSYMIGDALTDIEAGQRAGVKAAILVKTGRGQAQALLDDKDRLLPFWLEPSLKDAIHTIVNMEKQTAGV